MPKRRVTPIDVAKCFIEKNVDREGVAKHLINRYFGKKVSYDDYSGIFSYSYLLNTRNTFCRLMYLSHCHTIAAESGVYSLFYLKFS